MALYRPGLGCAGCAAIVSALLAAGCATSPVPRQASDPVPDQTEAVVPVATADVPDGTGQQPTPRFAGAPMFVVVDDDRDRDLELLRVFSARLGRPYRILNLAHRSAGSVSIRLAREAPVDVIALGPSALAAAGGIPGVRVVHAGVFDDVRDSPGVDALPPFDVQLDYWTHQNPDLKRVGVIGGPLMGRRMEDLAAACRARGLVLEARTVDSDQETLLAFRSMVPKIDGFVFLPDERVLSPSVIQRVVDHGRSNNVQMLVYSPVMFNLGATLYVQPDPVSVARTLVALVNRDGTAGAVREMRVRSRLSGKLILSSVDPDAFDAHAGVGY